MGNQTTTITISNSGITYELEKLVKNNAKYKISDGKITAKEWNETLNKLADINEKRIANGEKGIFSCQCYDKGKGTYKDNFVVHPGQKIEFTEDEMKDIYAAMGVELTNPEKEVAQKETPAIAKQSEPKDSIPIVKKETQAAEVRTSDSTTVSQTPEIGVKTDDSAPTVSQTSESKADRNGALLTVGAFLLVCLGVVLFKNKAKNLNKELLAGEKKISLAGKFRLMNEKIKANRIVRQVSKQEAIYDREHAYFMQQYKKAEEGLKNAEYDFPDVIKHASCGENRSIIETYENGKTTWTLVNDKKYGSFGSSVKTNSDGILMECVSDGTLKKTKKCLGKKNGDYFSIGGSSREYRRYTDGKVELIERPYDYNETVQTIQNGKIKKTSNITKLD